MWNIEKWKILAWYPNKMWRYRQQNPKCSDWRWTNFQMQMAWTLPTYLTFATKKTPIKKMNTN